MTKMSQGPWTRIRPLQSDEVDDKTQVAIIAGELTWVDQLNRPSPGFPNNLIKTIAYLPRMAQLEVEYVNSFIFDPVTIVHGVQVAGVVRDLQVTGFNERFLKELVISRTSLANRSRYSVTHHSVIGMTLFDNAGRHEEGHQKLLHLHEHDKHPEVYTELERVVLDYTVKVTYDAHQVSDDEFARLRAVLAANNRTQQRLSGLDEAAMARHVDTQIVELTWLIGQFCLLNRWFTALQVPNEGPQDEADFGPVYEQVVPEDIRQRNERVLDGLF